MDKQTTLENVLDMIYECLHVTPPKPNSPWHGGIYAGSRIKDGQVIHIITTADTSHDLVGQQFKIAENVQFGQINGRSDWHAGDQEDLMLAFINCRERFVNEGSGSIYWTRTVRDGYPWGYPWAVDFENGFTITRNRHDEYRLRPFRYQIGE